MILIVFTYKQRRKVNWNKTTNEKLEMFYFNMRRQSQNYSPENTFNWGNVKDFELRADFIKSISSEISSL